MQLNLSESSIKLGKNIIYFPEQYKKKLNIEKNKLIKLKQLNGADIILQVQHACLDDVITNENTSYVSQELFESLRFDSDVGGTYKVSLGCDPEFFIVNTKFGNIVHAHKYFDKWETMGSDGMLAEIRPAPSYNPCKVVNNIRKLLKEGNNKIKEESGGEVQMHAASFYKGVTAGFHIHFGLPKELLGENVTTRKIATQFTRILDYYIGIICAIHEGYDDSHRRCTAIVPYGKAGDFRMDSRTLEYRVPGGIMLRHPILTKGLLSVAAVIAVDLITKMSVATNNFQNIELLEDDKYFAKLYPNVPGLLGIYGLICVPDISGALAHLSIILEDIRAMQTYNRHAVAIESLFANLTNTFDTNMEQNWDLAEHQNILYH